MLLHPIPGTIVSIMAFTLGDIVLNLFNHGVIFPPEQEQPMTSESFPIAIYKPLVIPDAEPDYGFVYFFYNLYLFCKALEFIYGLFNKNVQTVCDEDLFTASLYKEVSASRLQFQTMGSKINVQEHMINALTELNRKLQKNITAQECEAVTMKHALMAQINYQNIQLDFLMQESQLKSAMPVNIDIQTAIVCI